MRIALEFAKVAKGSKSIEKMTTQANSHLLDAIGARKNFTAFANAFRQHDLDVVGVGWVNTRNKLEVLLEKQDVGAEAADAVRDIYIENLLYCNKAVFFWLVETAFAEQVAGALTAMVQSDHPYAQRYPYPLPQEQLNSIPGGSVATAVTQNDGSITLVFCAKRSVTEEEVIPTESVPEAFKVAGFSELIGKKYKNTQVFDSITVRPATGLIELRIDNAKTLSEADILKYKNAILTAFHDKLRPAIGETLPADCINLVDALSPLYRGKEWTVQRIGHVNEGGYINANRGRHKSDDVRKDKYHVSGEVAVQHLQLWSVTAIFSSRLGSSQPSLMLEGHSKMLSSEHPFMDLARILECTGEDDYNLVLEALLDCLKPADESEAEKPETAPI